MRCFTCKQIFKTEKDNNVIDNIFELPIFRNNVTLALRRVSNQCSKNLKSKNN